jgi:hypothetical protein
MVCLDRTMSYQYIAHSEGKAASLFRVVDIVPQQSTQNSSDLTAKISSSIIRPPNQQNILMRRQLSRGQSPGAVIPNDAWSRGSTSIDGF